MSKPRPSIRGVNNPAKRLDVREKIRYKLKGKPSGMKGKHQTNKAKVALRKANLGKVLSQITRYKIKKKRLHQIFPTKDTSIEKKMQNALEIKGIVFEKHKPITGQPDIFIEPNICIFCDGDYWHNRDDYKKRDIIVNDILTKEGYIILRFWEHQINNDIHNCVKTIQELSESTLVEIQPLSESIWFGQAESMKQEAPSERAE